MLLKNCLFLRPEHQDLGTVELINRLNFFFLILFTAYAHLYHKV